MPTASTTSSSRTVSVCKFVALSSSSSLCLGSDGGGSRSVMVLTAKNNRGYSSIDLLTIDVVGSPFLTIGALLVDK